MKSEPYSFRSESRSLNPSMGSIEKPGYLLACRLPKTARIKSSCDMEREPKWSLTIPNEYRKWNSSRRSPRRNCPNAKAPPLPFPAPRTTKAKPFGTSNAPGKSAPCWSICSLSLTRELSIELLFQMPGRPLGCQPLNFRPLFLHCDPKVVLKLRLRKEVGRKPQRLA